MSLPLSTEWLPIPGGITSPDGFLAAGISSGLKGSGKKDLALLFCPEGTVCAGTFTKSAIRAACVDLCKNRLQKKNGMVRSVVINSGHANACTGDRGLIDSVLVTKKLAHRLRLQEEEVLICSTGVIGEPIPMKNLLNGVDPLVDRLSYDGAADAANAILTTDLKVKQIAIEASLGGRTVRIGGMAKGSGMIHPDMATMLAYITCDVAIPLDIWTPMIKRVVNLSFNCITVDGDTSTNDSFLAFNAGDSIDKKYLAELESGLRVVCTSLAKAIARDGEGANCLIEVKVEGAQQDCDARHIARTICSSSLVKTAIHGADPNWGRILAALGRSGVPVLFNDVGLWIGSHQLLDAGLAIAFDRSKISSYIQHRLNGTYLNDDTVNIRLVVGRGEGVGIAWGCDLSDEYVRINADYTT